MYRTCRQRWFYVFYSTVDAEYCVRTKVSLEYGCRGLPLVVVMKLLYGGRPSETHTFGDQLGLVPGTKLKIEDGSTVGTSVTLRTAVADFR